ncbi:MAG: acetoacetate decarboxylase family protein, partial [Proteobacteria bacterium]|nr:acetoacetate decarboxylase family protein [Pseudomonadota bacterium]
LSLAAIDYRDNDLGDYNEVSIAFFVRPRGDRPAIPYLGNLLDLFRGRLGTFIYRLPVNQSFTRDAGEGIWGFPKTVEQIDMEKTATSCTCRLVMDGQHVLTVTLPRGGERTMSGSSLCTYTLIDGAPHRTRFTQGGTGTGFGRGSGVALELGGHPLAEELRSLGLPKRPFMTVWTEHMHGRFDAPEKL